MSPVKANTPTAKSKTPSKAKTQMFTPPKTRRRSMKPSTPKAATPLTTIPDMPKQAPQSQKKKTPKPAPMSPAVVKTPQKQDTPKKQKTPQKQETPKKQKTPQNPQSAKKTFTPAPGKVKGRTMTAAERETDDKRTLFIKALPVDCTESSLRAISKDIVEVRLREAKWQKKNSNKYAYIVFKSEASALEHFASIKKIDGTRVCVDLVGKKAKTDTKRRHTGETVSAPTKLFVTGLAFTDEDLDEMKNLLDCTEVNVPRAAGSSSKHRGFAFAHFKSASAATAALKAHQHAVINGGTLVLKHAQVHTYEKKEAPKAKKAKSSNGKKAPVEEVEEESEEDDMEDDEESDEE